MTLTPLSPSPVEDLTRRIDEAVAAGDSKTICGLVKRALQDFSEHEGALDESMMEAVPNGYGRRLLHRDPEDRYTVVVMTWGPGQGTPIHDHSGLWCVECVCRGRIRVKSYNLAEETEQGYVRFEPATEVLAGVGEAGALIPPFDYHVIENPFEETAATLHVYGGEMTCCEVFIPVDGQADGVCARVEKKLRYTGE